MAPTPCDVVETQVMPTTTERMEAAVLEETVCHDLVEKPLFPNQAVLPEASAPNLPGVTTVPVETFGHGRGSQQMRRRWRLSSQNWSEKRPKRHLATATILVGSHELGLLCVMGARGVGVHHDPRVATTTAHPHGRALMGTHHPDLVEGMTHQQISHQLLRGLHEARTPLHHPRWARLLP